MLLICIQNLYNVRKVRPLATCLHIIYNSPKNQDCKFSKTPRYFRHSRNAPKSMIPLYIITCSSCARGKYDASDNKSSKVLSLFIFCYLGVPERDTKDELYLYVTLLSPSASYRYYIRVCSRGSSEDDVLVIN